MKNETLKQGYDKIVLHAKNKTNYEGALEKEQLEDMFDKYEFASEGPFIHAYALVSNPLISKRRIEARLLQITYTKEGIRDGSTMEIILFSKENEKTSKSTIDYFVKKAEKIVEKYPQQISIYFNVPENTYDKIQVV